MSRALALMDHPLDSSDQLLAAHGGKVLQRIIAVCPRRVLDSPRFPDLVTQASYKVRSPHPAPSRGSTVLAGPAGLPRPWGATSCRKAAPLNCLRSRTYALR